MEQVDPKTGQRPVPQLVDDVLGRAERDRRGRRGLLVVDRGVGLTLLELVTGDARAHDVRLVPALDLLAHPCPDALDPLRLLRQGYDARLHRAAAGRELDQRGDLEVTEDRHRHRARDGRRGHHQHVGRHPRLVGEGRSLLDPEAVLLVDDHEPEVGELHVLLQERVGADDDAGLTAGRPQHRLGARGPGHRARQQGDRRGVGMAAQHATGAEVAEQVGDRPQVLLGQHLGRREEGCLAARVDHPQHGAQGDERLARADLALQQAVHRVRAREVGLDLGGHLVAAPR